MFVYIELVCASVWLYLHTCLRRTGCKELNRYKNISVYLQELNDALVKKHLPRGACYN